MSGAEKTKQEQVVAQIWSLLEPLLQAQGIELVEVEYRRESLGWVLRLFIDQESGITVEDCAGVSQMVGDMLDVADPIQNPYNLEVSSPGLNRPIRKPEHFQRYIGKTVEVRTAAPIQGRRNFKGVLVDSDNERITINCEGQVFEIPMTNLERTRLCYFDSYEQ